MAKFVFVKYGRVFMKLSYIFLPIFIRFGGAFLKFWISNFDKKFWENLVTLRFIFVVCIVGAIFDGWSLNFQETLERRKDLAKLLFRPHYFGQDNLN